MSEMDINSFSRVADTKMIDVAVAKGDGIGPEIMSSVLSILKMAEAPLRFRELDIGAHAYEAGHTSGIPPEAWQTLRETGVLLKAPITTPQGGGYKSLNVTLRKTLNLYANVRPTKSYAPFVASQHPGMNLVIVRENEEDLYAGIEHQQTPEVAQVLKLVTRPGCERIIRYAFEYARLYGRRSVTAMSKDNIMKQTDGLFHRVFNEISEEYPEIDSEHQIIDIGAARLAAQPERFDVVVTLNLYGDILSDIASQIAGSVGIAGSANIGPDVAMFEAVHGSAPAIAGRDIANPSGLLVAATQMLVHVGQAEIAQRIKNAWLRTLEDGIHTPDVHREGLSRYKVGTKAFTEAVIERLNQRPRHLTPVTYQPGRIQVDAKRRARPDKSLVGVDVFLDWSPLDRDPERLGRALEQASPDTWQLKMITNRGVKVYPDGVPETFVTDHWRCRFIKPDGADTDFGEVLELLTALQQVDFDVIKIETLCTFDGKAAYSMGQGE